jgi:CheY-like chemotaxis protein
MPITVTSSCRLVLADRGSNRKDLVKALNEAGVPTQECPQDLADFENDGLWDMDVLVEIQGKDLSLADYFPEIAALKTWQVFGCLHSENNQPILVLTRKKTQSSSQIADANDEILTKLRRVFTGLKGPKGQAMFPVIAPYLDAPTILLVDDETLVRRIIRWVLQDQGFFVLEAANGADAFLLAEQFPYPIHLLVTDLSMPKMNGLDLAGRLATLHPEAGVLFFSGYSDENLPSKLFPDPAMAFLQKPFTREALLTKVREVLTRKK